MQIIAADDDPVARKILEVSLTKWGFEPVMARDGDEAWAEIQARSGSLLMILDWMMPGMDGPEICRRVRPSKQHEGSYIILLTSREGSDALVAGLEAGADDYVTKPFLAAELHARIQVGVRVVELQQTLAARYAELKRALDEVHQLQGLIPICTYCKRIRDDSNYWQAVESYVGSRAAVEFSHGICPECHEKHIKPQLEELMRARAESDEAE